MASSKTIPMIVEFPRWLAATTVGEDSARSETRWSAISALAVDMNTDRLEALLRLTLSYPKAPPTDGEVRKIREVFYAADNTFEMCGNSRELQILAASTLAAALTLASNGAARAAVATSTAFVGGLRRPSLPMDLATLAEKAVERISDVSRQRPALTASSFCEPLKLDATKAIEKANEATSAGTGEALDLLVKAIRPSLARLARQQSEIVTAIDGFLRMQDEELQIHWWLTGGRSTEFNKRFEAVGQECQPLVFGKELANLTGFLPGPRSIRAILTRAGLKATKKVMLREVINAPDDPWLNGLVADKDPSPVTTPVHFGIKRRLETGAGSAWVPPWTATTGLPEDISLSSLEIGMQFYRERLLLQHLKDPE